jgi:predicted dehydrogenase
MEEQFMEHTRVTPNELNVPESIPLPKRKDWRIGMVGFGGIARGAHAPSYQSVGWQIAAVADPDPNARKEAKEKFGVQRIYTDYRELIADDEVEVIDLCTHPVIREDVVLAAADSGKHIITEKPFGMRIEECTRMIEAADQAGIKLAVHQNYRWMKMNYLAHHIINRGFIGKPFFVSIEIFGRQDVTLAKHPFYSQCDNFLTVQWDNHLADLLRYWTGHDATRVLARTGRMDGQNFLSDNLLLISTAIFDEERFCEEVQILDAGTGRFYNKYGDGIIDAKTSIVYVQLDENPSNYEEAIKINDVWYLPNRRHLKPSVLRAEIEEVGFKVLYQDGGNLICRL